MSSAVNIILGVLGAQGAIGALDGVRSSLGGLAATALGTTSALAGLQHGLSLGGELVDLAARTGQTERDLTVLRRALDNAGIGAANAAPMIGLLQKSIAGFNEEGGKTGDVFKRLGLEPARLRELGVQEQLTALSAAFQRIPNAADRAATAMQLFGRSGAQMLQLLGDSSALAVAERESGRLATRLQEDAAAFDEVSDKLSIAKVRMNEFWVVAAEKALPVLRSIAGALESINPAPLAAATTSIMGIFGAAAALKVVEKLNWAVLMFATNPAISGAGQMFAQRFIAPFTSGLAVALQAALPAIIAGLVAGAILQGIAQAMEEKNRAEIAASNAAARESQRRRDALRGSMTLDQLEAQRRETAAEIKRLEDLQKTQQIGSRTIYDSEGRGIAGRQEVPIFGLNADQARQLEELRRLQKVLASDRPQAIIAANQEAAAAAARLTQARELVEELRKQADSYKTARTEGRYALSNDHEKLRLLEQQAEAATKQYLVDLEAGQKAGDMTAIKAAQTKHEAALLAIARERKAVEQSITEEGKRRAAALEAAQEKAKQAEIELLRTRTDAAKLRAEDRQLEIQRQLADLQADFTRTDAEKWTERRQLLQEAVTAAQAYLGTMRELRAAAKTDEARQLGDAAVHSAQQDLVGAQNQLAGIGPNPNNLVEQMRASLTSLRSEWGTTSQQIAGGMRDVIGGAVGSLSAGISGFILRTKSLREAWAGVATTIATTVVEALVQLGVRWVANQILMATVGRSLQAASVASAIPMAAAASAIWSTPATLATIATFGGAAMAAPGFIAASTAMSKLQALPGFYEGGYTGETGGVVHQREFVFSAPAVRNIGLDRLEAMHDSARSGSVAMPSPTGGGDAAGAPRVYVLFDRTSFARAMQEDSAGWFQDMSAQFLRKHS